MARDVGPPRSLQLRHHRLSGARAAGVLTAPAYPGDCDGGVRAAVTRSGHGMAVQADPLRLVVGDKAAKRLASAFDLHTVGDLLDYYPRRYDKRGS